MEQIHRKRVCGVQQVRIVWVIVILDVPPCRFVRRNNYAARTAQSSPSKRQSRNGSLWNARPRNHRSILRRRTHAEISGVDEIDILKIEKLKLGGVLMKACDLKPTYENLLTTYRDDAIGRNMDVFRFVGILNSVEDAFSIALDGNWGSGKTFFVKQVKMVMDAHNEFISSKNTDYRTDIVKIRNNYLAKKAYDINPQVCVYYDAWENDNADEPIMSLVYTIMQSADTDFTFNDVNVIKKGAHIISAFTGTDWVQVIKNLIGDSPLNTIRAEKTIQKKVNDFLSSLLPERGNRLVVFIDELDRCKPDFAIKLLERIKHYFDHKDITFVFSVNINELQHTIKKYYGDEFDGSRYLDRFFDLRVTLPAPNMIKFYRSINFSSTHDVYNFVCDAVIKYYHFELREIFRFVHLSKIMSYEKLQNFMDLTFSDGSAMKFCLYYVIPIMIGLRVCDSKKYTDFIYGRNSKPLLEIADLVSRRGLFDGLLDNSETYDINDKQSKLVTVRDKLEAVYTALFVTEYDNMNYETKVGSCEFSEKTKKNLLRIVSLLSEYTDANFE